MTTDEIIATVLFIAACVGLVAYALTRVKKKVPHPEKWIHIGLPPPKGVEKALEIIKQECPEWAGRYGGTIEWVKDPFWLGFVHAAGGVIEFEEPYIKLMYNDDITKTAIAHEVFHVYQNWYMKDQILDGNPKLYAWVNSTNNKIRAAIV